jgi:integrase
MRKKHRNKITVNGKGYDYYRKQATYKGQTHRFSADNKDAWEAKVEDWKRQVDSSVLTTDPKMTVNQLAELFHKDALASARPKTIEERESKLRIYILPVIGYLKLRDVTSADIEPIYENAENVSASTLEHVNKVCHRMFEFAIENEYVITRNPISKGLTKRVNRIVASSKQTTDADDFGLGLEDIDAILMESKGKPYEIIIHWQLLHGLRIEEALGMMWEDIDFVKNAIGIYRGVSDTPRSTVKGSRWANDGVGPIITPPKTARSRRDIPLQAQTKSLLEQIPSEERQGFIYVTAEETPFYPTNYRKRVFAPFRKQLGLDTMLTHDLRKAFGSVLLLNGVDIMTVSLWMGHSSPEVTMRIYAKVLPEAEKWHSDTIGKALFR